MQVRICAISTNVNGVLYEVLLQSTNVSSINDYYAECKRPIKMTARGMIRAVFMQLA